MKDEAEGKKVNSKWKEQEEALQQEESIAESGRIFFRNLTYSVTEDDLTKLFEQYGNRTRHQKRIILWST